MGRRLSVVQIAERRAARAMAEARSIKTEVIGGFDDDANATMGNFRLGPC
jgi:hypothetical protein